MSNSNQALRPESSTDSTGIEILGVSGTHESPTFEHKPNSSARVDELQMQERGTRASSYGSGYQDDENQYKGNEGLSGLPTSSNGTSLGNDDDQQSPSSSRTPHLKPSASLQTFEDNYVVYSPPTQSKQTKAPIALPPPGQLGSRRARDNSTQARPSDNSDTKTDEHDSTTHSTTAHTANPSESSLPSKRARTTSGSQANVVPSKRAMTNGEKKDNHPVAPTVPVTPTSSPSPHNEHDTITGEAGGTERLEMETDLPSSSNKENENDLPPAASTTTREESEINETRAEGTAATATNEEQVNRNPLQPREDLTNNPTPFTQGSTLNFAEITGPEIPILDENEISRDFWGSIAERDLRMDELKKKWKETEKKMQIWLKRGQEVQAERQICMLSSKLNTVREKEREAAKIRSQLGKFVQLITNAQEALMAAAQDGDGDAGAGEGDEQMQMV